MHEPLAQVAHLQAVLDQHQDGAQAEVIVIDLPQAFSRMCTYRALEQHLGCWDGRPDTGTGGQRPACRPLVAFLDLSLHPGFPAQTIIGSSMADWPDLAEGLPAALAPTEILVIVGAEHMLRQTPHRLAALLQAHGRERVVMVLTQDADAFCALGLRDTSVRIDRSLVEGLQMGAKFSPTVQRLAEAALEAARLGAVPDALQRKPSVGGLG